MQGPLKPIHRSHGTKFSAACNYVEDWLTNGFQIASEWPPN